MVATKSDDSGMVLSIDGKRDELLSGLVQA
jgi:hypothetical protein